MDLRIKVTNQENAMKYLNIICTLILLLSAGIFVGYIVQRNAHFDNEGPNISIDSDVLQVSVQDNKTAYLQGVSAMDNIDGDVTESLGVESISTFKEDQTREVKYVAFDSNNNVTKATRHIQYTDYKPIKFTLDGPLRFPSDKGNTDILGIVHAQDCLDGDISDQISFAEDNVIYPSIASDYKISLIVKNSAGDTEELPVTVTIYDPIIEKGCPQISLKKYLIYTKKGEEIELKNNIEGITLNGKEYTATEGRGTYNIDTSEMTREELTELSKEDPTVSLDKFTITGDIDYNTAGTYEVNYSILSPENEKGSVNLIVIVEEGK